MNKSGDQYADLWEVDFTTSANRKKYRAQRDLVHEMMVERKITHLLRETFSFRFVSVPKEHDRIGGSGLERALIGTCAECNSCGPSSKWLGLHSTKLKIRDSGLWLVQHLNAPCLTEQQVKILDRYVKQTEKMMSFRLCQHSPSFSVGNERYGTNILMLVRRLQKMRMSALISR